MNFSSRRVLTLYGRRGCHLCDDMQVALETWRSRLGFSLHIVDVASDPALEHRFGAKVPVLTEGEREICHYFLDEDALVGHFEGAD